MEYERHIDLRLVGPIRARTEAYRRAKRVAESYVHRAFSTCSLPAYVSVSGGKDSVAMLGIVADVARRMERPLRAWAHVSDASFPGTVETCRTACERAGVELTVDESSVSAWDVVGQQSQTRFGKTGLFFDAIAAQLAKGSGLVFVGVRAAESARRAKACRAHGPVFTTTIPAFHTKCHPIQDFTIEDVAAAIHEYGMPIHPIYGKIPVGDLPIRLGYATSIDLLDRGTVVFMRRNYPLLYQRLLQVYPKAMDYK